MHRPFLFLPTLLCLFSAAEDFEIKFDRPPTAGDKFSVTTRHTKDETVSAVVDGNKLPTVSSSTTVELAALGEFLRYDRETRSSQKKYTIERCTKTTEAEKTEVLRKGQVVTATGNGEKTQFDVDNRTAAEDIAWLLDMVISAQGSPVSEDELYGSLERKQVGDIWPIRAHAIKKVMVEKLALPEDPQLLTGTVKLAALKEIDGVRCLSFAIQIQIGKFPPFKHGPSQTIEKLELSAEGIMEIPVKPGNSTGHYVRKMTMEMTTTEDRNGKKVRSELSSKQTEEVNYREIK